MGNFQRSERNAIWTAGSIDELVHKQEITNQQGVLHRARRDAKGLNHKLPDDECKDEDINNCLGIFFENRDLM